MKKINKKSTIIFITLLLTLSGVLFAAVFPSNNKNNHTAAATGSAVSGAYAETITPSPVPTKKPLKALHNNKPAGTKISIKGRKKSELKTMFYVKKIDDNTWTNMQGKSYHRGCPVKRSALRRIRILYYGFDKKTYIGELITNKTIAADCRDIFKKLYFKKYQIESVIPIDEFNGDDEASMSANNTSCFNYRTISGSSKVSKHGYGLAIDINPRYNPYVHTVNGKTVIEPKNGKKYADRKKSFKHKITHSDYCYKLFHKKSFTWGGDWKSVRDYQHFER